MPECYWVATSWQSHASKFKWDKIFRASWKELKYMYESHNFLTDSQSTKKKTYFIISALFNLYDIFICILGILWGVLKYALNLSLTLFLNLNCVITQLPNNLKKVKKRLWCMIYYWRIFIYFFHTKNLNWAIEMNLT